VTALSRSSPLLTRTRSNGDGLVPKIAQLTPSRSRRSRACQWDEPRIPDEESGSVHPEWDRSELGQRSLSDSAEPLAEVGTTGYLAGWLF
jgi:hypothetical protein